MFSSNLSFDSLYAVKYELLTLVASIVIWQQWRSWHRLSNFKGPFLASLSNLWMANSIAHRRAHLDLFEVSEKYGELARVGPNILLTSDPDLVQRMSSARSGYTRSEWYSGQKLEVDHENLFSTIDEKTHTRRRAQMAGGFSGREIPELEATVDKHILELIRLIKTSYVSSKYRPMDLARKLSFFGMDVTCDIAFGQPWGCLSKDEDVDKWFETNEIVLPNAIMFSTIPWMAKLFSIPLVGRMVMPSEKDPTGAGRLLFIIKEIVRKRFSISEHEQRKDMMGSFIRHGITKTEAVSEASLQIVAGTDTTGTVLRTTMLYIITNPHVYLAVHAEVDSFKSSTSKDDAIISDEEAKTLPYLQAVIKEGARMCPPATGLLSKKTPPEGDTINGRFVPGGTDIGQCAWGLQRSKIVYGEDSMLFRPERWLEAKGEKLEKMEKSVGLVWGFGKYSCLGKNISWLEMDKVFFELLTRFDFTLVDPTRPWKSENVGLWMQSEMFVKVTERVQRKFSK